MKRLIVCALLVLLPSLALAQSSPETMRRATLMWAYDLDGEAADADQIVTAANGDLTDSKTFTITAQPDVCRLVDMTVTDANSSLTAGAITVTGTGCLGETKVCSFTFAAGGSGVKSFTCTDGDSAYFGNITDISTGVLTGEGGAGVDLCTIGYTSNSVNAWPMYGTIFTGPSGEYQVNPFGSFEVKKLITTSGSATTTVDGKSAADDAFATVVAGDLLLINVSGTLYERKVTAKASDDQITVNRAINIPAAGVYFSRKPMNYSSNPNHAMLLPVGGYRSLLVNWSVDANANTGGTITLFECTDGRQPDWPATPWVSISTTTVNSGSTQVPTGEAVDLLAKPYSWCRFGVKFGTGDDTDTAPEDINVSITLMK